MIKLFKALLLWKRSFPSPSPDRRNSKGGVEGESLGDKNRMYRLFMKAAGERRSRRRPYFCAYTNSAKEMSVFVRQIYHIEHFL